MKSFFSEAGLALSYDPTGIFGRGMYVYRSQLLVGSPVTSLQEREHLSAGERQPD
jgi:hypothetical protein